jgi:ABC-2 type transport system permease protein
VIRREQGILKRIRATPLPPPTYLAAVLASILLVFAVQALVLVGLGRLLYGAELPTRPFSLLFGAAVGAVAFAAMGVGMSGLIRSAEGSSPIVNVIVLPMTFLSGGFGPARHFPQALRAVADVLPLKYLIDVLKSIYLDHESITSQGAPLAVVAAWGVVGLVVALRAFRWEPREV